jgi:hypothetical protein
MPVWAMTHQESKGPIPEGAALAELARGYHVGKPVGVDDARKNARFIVFACVYRLEQFSQELPQ